MPIMTSYRNNINAKVRTVGRAILTSYLGMTKESSIVGFEISFAIHKQLAKTKEKKKR
jgi:hypothetical protein